jgi:branched-chain amino acid transport system ATP-binding protein
MSAILETRALCKSFGALVVAEDISFRLEAGARHALIGPNGAGKTTFVNMLTGLLAPSSGRVLLGGEDITRLAQAARVKRGIGRTFQINTLFREMSVLDNVALGVAERQGVAGRLWGAASRHRRVRDETFGLLWPMASSGWSRSPLRLGSGRGCCCSTNRPPACLRSNLAGFSKSSTGCPEKSAS